MLGHDDYHFRFIELFYIPSDNVNDGSMDFRDASFVSQSGRRRDATRLSHLSLEHVIAL
jgi:hypothetical protein